MKIKIDIQALKTRPECDEALTKLDAVIGDIEDQMRNFSVAVVENRVDADDWQWCADAKGALKKYKRLRQAVQNHKGTLPKPRKPHQRTIEGLFIDAAMELLPREVITKIWDLAHELEDEQIEKALEEAR